MTKQPDSIEIKMIDDLFVKSIHIHDRYTLVPQHSHAYDHVSMLAVGAIRVWKDDELVGDFVAPCGIVIEKHTKHKFLSLLDNTLIYCIHNLHSAEAVSVHEENALSELDHDILQQLANGV